jgi:hypothetical protein
VRDHPTELEGVVCDVAGDKHFTILLPEWGLEKRVFLDRCVCVIAGQRFYVLLEMQRPVAPSRRVHAAADGPEHMMHGPGSSRCAPSRLLLVLAAARVGEAASGVEVAEAGLGHHVTSLADLRATENAGRWDEI